MNLCEPEFRVRRVVCIMRRGYQECDHQSQAVAVCQAVKESACGCSVWPEISLYLLTSSVSTVNTVSDCLFLTGRTETGEGWMVEWLEHRCAANSQGVEVDFIQVCLEVVTRTVCTFCLVPSFFFRVFPAIFVAVPKISGLLLTHSSMLECFGITPTRRHSAFRTDSLALSPCPTRVLFFCFFLSCYRLRTRGLYQPAKHSGFHLFSWSNGWIRKTAQG